MSTVVGVAQRTADDCGVACLATLTGHPYIHALCVLFPGARLGDTRTLSTTERRMRRGLGAFGWKLSRKRGVNGIEGERGLILVRWSGEDGASSLAHWLAWERDEAGVVWVWNPQGAGELFEYKPGALHNRGFRLMWWVSATRKTGV